MLEHKADYFHVLVVSGLVFLILNMTSLVSSTLSYFQPTCHIFNNQRDRVWLKRKFYTSGKWKTDFKSLEDMEPCSEEPIACSNYAWDTEMICKWKTYDPNLTKKCLIKNELVVMGDSRARQIYRAMEQRTTGEKAIDYTPWHWNKSIPFPEIIYHHDTALKFYWMKKFKNLETMLTDNLFNFKKNPKTLILGEHFLWSVEMNQGSNKSMEKDDYVNKKYVSKAEQYKKDFTEIIIPIITELANSGNKILWMSIEYRQDFVVKKGGQVSYAVTDPDKIYQSFHNHLMDDINNHIENEIAAMNHENIYYFSSNSRNTLNLSKTAVFLGDLTHKMKRDKNITLPFPLWLDTNYMLNFVCNQEL